MTATTTTTALVPIQPAFSDTERLALAGYLAGYRGLTREAYALDLRQFTTWCRARSLNLFAVRRADIEGFARDLEARGRARATVTRRLCTIAGFYKYTVEEELLEHSPAAHVRRPRVDYESHAVALDRNELGALLVSAGLGPPTEHALISLLALNGLRVSEATGADIEQLGLDRGHRTLTITRKGGKVVTIPLAPRTARAIDLAIVERTDGPVFLAVDGRRLDRHGAGRIVRKVARRAGITKGVTPHTLRHAFITAAQGRGVASDATFREKREDTGPALQLPRPSGRAGRIRKRSGDDLRCHHPVASTARMLQPLLLHPATRMMRQMQRKAQRRGGMPPSSARQAQVFGRVGKPLPTSLDAGVPLRDVQEAASHADPRTTMRYDRARGSLDRHATYIVAAYVAGAAR
jgi:integrase/recombinase XerD